LAGGELVLMFNVSCRKYVLTVQLDVVVFNLHFNVIVFSRSEFRINVVGCVIFVILWLFYETVSLWHLLWFLADKGSILVALE
jgi:hypothetical protein